MKEKNSDKTAALITSLLPEFLSNHARASLLPHHHRSAISERHRIGIITEVPLLSGPLMSMGPRMSPRASWPPFC